jgi:hypothetical protein
MSDEKESVWQAWYRLAIGGKVLVLTIFVAVISTTAGVVHWLECRYWEGTLALQKIELANQSSLHTRELNEQQSISAEKTSNPPKVSESKEGSKGTQQINEDSDLNRISYFEFLLLQEKTKNASQQEQEAFSNKWKNAKICWECYVDYMSYDKNDEVNSFRIRPEKQQPYHVHDSYATVYKHDVKSTLLPIFLNVKTNDRLLVKGIIFVCDSKTCLIQPISIGHKD